MHPESREGALPQIVRIREIRDETRTIRTFVLDAEVPAAQPGQFVAIQVKDDGENEQQAGDEPLPGQGGIPARESVLANGYHTTTGVPPSSPPEESDNDRDRSRTPQDDGQIDVRGRLLR